MKEIVIMSGKGGTGKTTITAAIGALAKEKAVVADCDVDAANLHLLFSPKNTEAHEFVSGKTAVINYNKCTDCGVCQQKCRFDAIDFINGKYVIDEVACEGCSVCHYLCPEKAIDMRDNTAGKWFISDSRFGSRFVHAKLGIGQENSGKLVGKVKAVAKEIAEKEKIPFIIVDGPPGIGCPVISAFSGATHILIVTEASESGFHDLKRLVELVEYFKVTASCIINKCDLNNEASGRIEKFCNNHNINVINKIKYQKVFYETLQQGKTLVESDDNNIKEKIEEIWNYLKNME